MLKKVLACNGYVNLSYRAYKKVITSFAQNSLRLFNKVFSLLLLSFKQFKVSNLYSEIFFLSSATAAG